MKIAVIGAGIVGLSTSHRLVSSGQHEVRCYEAVAPMSARSKGDTRIFRLYHRDRRLVALAAESLEVWRRLEAQHEQALLGRQGLMVPVADAPNVARVMESAGQVAEVLDGTNAMSGLTSRSITGPVLWDASAGVINVTATGEMLRRVVEPSLRIEEVLGIEPAHAGATVVTATDRWQCDAVLIAAGLNTADLAVMAGINVPSERHHHARFTYALRDPEASPPCLLDNQGGLPTYGQSTLPGYWAIGGHLDATFTEWSVGEDAAATYARDAVSTYVREHLDSVIPEVVEEIHCDVDSGGGDGLHAQRNGSVVAFWGDNLMKFGPLLGDRLAEALSSESPLDLPLD